MKHLHFSTIMAISIMGLMPPSTTAATDSTTDLHKYHVSRNGKKVGAVIFRIGHGPRETRMVLESKITGQFIIELHVNQTSEVAVSDGRVTYAGVIRTINGSTKINRKVHLQPSGYKISGTRCSCTSLPREILFTSTQLFFTEPVGHKELFSEVLATMVPVIQKAPGSYRILLPNGDSSDYYYRNGILTRVVSKSFFGEVEMALQ